MAANRIYKVEEIFLTGWNDEDGKEIPIKIFPLTIKKFRAAADILDKAQEKVPEGEKEKPFLDYLLDTAAYAMKTYEPKLSDPDILGDYIDLDTLYYVLEVAIGVKLNDPNLQAAVAAAQTN